MQSSSSSRIFNPTLAGASPATDATLEMLTWRSHNQTRSSTADNPDFADVFVRSETEVAQVFNLPYRRISFCRPTRLADRHWLVRTPCRLQITNLLYSPADARRPGTPRVRANFGH